MYNIYVCMCVRTYMYVRRHGADGGEGDVKGGGGGVPKCSKGWVPGRAGGWNHRPAGPARDNTVSVTWEAEHTCQCARFRVKYGTKRCKDEYGEMRRLSLKRADLGSHSIEKDVVRRCFRLMNGRTGWSGLVQETLFGLGNACEKCVWYCLRNGVSRT
jgi:hypothetical protein